MHAFLREKNVTIKAPLPPPTTTPPLPRHPLYPVPSPPPILGSSPFLSPLSWTVMISPSCHCVIPPTLAHKVCCCCWWRLTSFVLSVSPFPWNPKHAAGQKPLNNVLGYCGVTLKECAHCKCSKLCKQLKWIAVCSFNLHCRVGNNQDYSVQPGFIAESRNRIDSTAKLN